MFVIQAQFHFLYFTLFDFQASLKELPATEGFPFIKHQLYSF